MLKFLVYTVVILLAVAIIPLSAAFASTFIGAIISGFLGLLVIVLLLAIPLAFIMLVLPVNHPWRVKVKQWSKK